MACRVGITQNLERRQSEWEKKHPSLRNWKKIGTYSTKAKAQEVENQYAQKHSCEAEAGGPDNPGDWHVYRFDY